MFVELENENLQMKVGEKIKKNISFIIIYYSVGSVGLLEKTCLEQDNLLEIKSSTRVK